MVWYLVKDRGEITFILPKGTSDKAAQAVERHKHSVPLGCAGCIHA